MNVAHELLKAALAAGVIVEAAGEKLKLRAKAAPPADLLAALREHKPELLAALTVDRPDREERSGHWLISLAPERLEKWFSPPITRAELAQRYPSAALVALPDAAPEPRSTGEREAELRRLVGLVTNAKRFTEAEHADALANALASPEAALASFRQTVREQGLDKAPHSCANSLRLANTGNGPALERWG